MLRWITVCLLLSATAVGLVWVVSPKIIIEPSAVSAPPSNFKDKETPPPHSVTSNWDSQGTLLRLIEFPKARSGNFSASIIIPNANLVIAEVQDVPSEKDGILLFIGTDVEEGEVVPPEKQLPPAQLGFLAVPLKSGEKPKDGEKTWTHKDVTYRRMRPDDELKPNRIALFTDERKVRKLKRGDVVKKGQLLALVDPKKAFDDVAVRVAKLNGSEADRVGSQEQMKTYLVKHRRILEGERITAGATSQDERDATWMQYQKFLNEEKLKAAEVIKAQRELNAGLTDLRMFEIRAGIDGVVKDISKNGVGEAIKVNETVLQIHNPNRLRVEGLLEVQEALKLKKGMKVIVEASRPESPRLVIPGHLGAVTCVAVSKGKHPVIISGSEDETLRGWDSTTGARLWELEGLRSAVRAAACTPSRAKRNLVLFGCADGSARILDPDNIKEKPRDLSERHQGAVNTVAFSPNGELCATGGDDTYIRLWDTATGKLLHRLRGAHRNSVTSVQFATDKKLVSAGRDNRLAVWDISGNYPKEVRPEFSDRGGEVAQLGVSPDGKTVLFDQGKELRLLSLADKSMEGTLQNPSDDVTFSTLALFSPDGKTILTNGPAAGKLQLWRTPLEQSRASELRQFVWTKGVATCGAFAPEDNFVVTGTQDRQVLVWSMPEQKEVESRLEANLTLVDLARDTESLKVRVWAELQNPGWLIPGSRATMVVPPQK